MTSPPSAARRAPAAAPCARVAGVERRARTIDADDRDRRRRSSRRSSSPCDADAFLRGMMRSFTGALVKIGRGRATPEWLASLVDAATGARSVGDGRAGARPASVVGALRAARRHAGARGMSGALTYQAKPGGARAALVPRRRARSDARPPRRQHRARAARQAPSAVHPAHQHR